MLEAIELFADELPGLQADAVDTSQPWVDRGIPERPLPAPLQPYSSTIAEPDVSSARPERDAVRETVEVSS